MQEIVKIHISILDSRTDLDSAFYGSKSFIKAYYAWIRSRKESIN